MGSICFRPPGDEDCGKNDGDDGDVDGDVHNFGLHTRDHLNQPDGQGRVLINVGHPVDEPDIFLAPQVHNRPLTKHEFIHKFENKN